MVESRKDGGLPVMWCFISVIWEELGEASERDRTSDLLITNQLLYRLSYAGLKRLD
jgi:hypothetical protein